ncbi:hypothetical protein CXB51_018229 [Gossypium anomalum]|uniref:Uncharacterized protein n=1 Tax=Gossypium anomalum TaxID=47600 RepID=A0A8J5ZGZ2_9ROSI|nr:hypothetical protein CXB51_018229 [Gossypium anomalum]
MCLIELIGSRRNKFQIYRFVRISQLCTSLYFYLTSIIMINGSPRHNLLLNSQNLCLDPRRDEEPLVVSTVLLKALGKLE